MSFASVEYKVNSTSLWREIHVWKYCKKARVPGLKVFIERHGQPRSVVLNGVRLDPNDYSFQKDKIVFKNTLWPDVRREKWLFGLITRTVSVPAEHLLGITFNTANERVYTRNP